MVIATMLVAVAVIAQTSKPAAQPALPPGVEQQVAARPEKATVGDPITVDFEWTLPKDYQLRFPQVGNELGDFSILEVHPGPTVPEGLTDATQGKEGVPSGAKVRYRARIVASLYKTGEFEFPPVQVGIRDGQGKELAVSTPGIKIHVQSVLNEKDQNLRDLKKQAEIHEQVRWILWLSLALLAVLLAALAWWWSSRRRVLPEARLPSQPELDPLDLAEAELRNLLGLGLLEKGLVKQFYVSLSEIIKKILEAGYSVQTFEKTTSEIMHSLRNGSRASGVPDFALIESLLINCDLVKFAKYIPPRTESETALKNTMDLLASCRQLRVQTSDQKSELSGSEV